MGEHIVNKCQTSVSSRAVNREQRPKMSHRCDIQLDNPRGAYRAGETVNGHVYLTLSERALIRGK